MQHTRRSSSWAFYAVRQESAYEQHLGILCHAAYKRLWGGVQHIWRNGRHWPNERRGHKSTKVRGPAEHQGNQLGEENRTKNSSPRRESKTTVLKESLPRKTNHVSCCCSPGVPEWDSFGTDRWYKGEKRGRKAQDPPEEEMGGGKSKIAVKLGRAPPSGRDQHY
jgi:hypothetical protein